MSIWIFAGPVQAKCDAP